MAPVRSLPRSHKSITRPCLDQVNPVRILPSCLNIHLNVIPPYVPSSSNRTLSFGICHQIPYSFLFSSIRAMCPIHCVLRSYEKIWRLRKPDQKGKNTRVLRSGLIYKKGKYMKYTLKNVYIMLKIVQL